MPSFLLAIDNRGRRLPCHRIGVTSILRPGRPLCLVPAVSRRTGTKFHMPRFLRIHRSICETQWGPVYRFALKLRAHEDSNLWRGGIERSRAGKLARRETRAHRASPSCLSFDHDYRERLFLQSVSKIHVIAFDLFFFSFLALVFGHRNCYFRFRSGLDFSRIESIGGRLPRRFNTRF